jgi:hypothetical protein
VAGEVVIRAAVEPAFIGMQAALAGDVLAHDLLDRVLVGNRDVERAHAPAALDKREDRALAGRAGLAALRVRVAAARRGLRIGNPAVIGFVGLDGFPAAAKHGRGHEPTFAHGLADAMQKEPRSFVIAAERALYLLCRNALLARAKQVVRLEPLMERDVRPLHHGSGHDREVLAALGVGAAVAAFLLRGVVLLPSAVMADWAFRPTNALHRLAGGGFILNGGGVELRGFHGAPDSRPTYYPLGLWRQVHIWEPSPFSRVCPSERRRSASSLDSAESHSALGSANLAER